MKWIVPVLMMSAALAVAQNAPNTLTRAEAKAGWKLMFDGKTFAGWVNPNELKPPLHAWVIEDGCIKTVPHSRTLEDLKTAESYTDFEMTFDWKVTAGANSGVKYRIQKFFILTPDHGPKGVSFEQQAEWALQNHPVRRDELKEGAPYQEYVVGFEYQVIDSLRHADAKRGPQYRAGALYGMTPPTKQMDHPAGEWNSSRLVVRGKHVQHYLNGELVVDTTLDASEVRASVEKRWKDAPGIRALLLDQPEAASPITLQHHFDEAWFRNLKIRRLK